MKKFILIILIFCFCSISQGQLLKEDLVIGTEKDQVYFGLIQSIDVDQNGTIYVSDWRTKNIRVFSQDGMLQETIGREGRGPGEFQQLDGSGLDNTGSLYAYDPNLIRVSIYDIKSKDLRKTIKIPVIENSTEYGSIPRDILVLNQNGEFLLRYIIPYSPGTSQKERTQRLVLFNDNGEIVKEPVITIPEDQKLIKDQGGNLTVGSMPFGRKSLVNTGPEDKVYTAWTEELRIRIYNKQGEHLKTVSGQVEKIPVSEADLQQKSDKSSSFDLLNSDQVPDFWPVLDWFVVDDQGRIWVAVNTEDRQNYSLRIYDQDGSVLGKTNLSKSVELKKITNDYAYGIQKGMDGIQSIIRYKIGEI